MVKKNKITNLMVFGGLMCFAPAAFADCPQTPAPVSGTVPAACMSLVDPGNSPFAGVYVGPYYASINGGPNTAVICDDYLDDSYIPEFWTADIYQGNGPLTSTRNATNPNPDSVGLSLAALPAPALQKAYDEVGYLALQLLNPSLDVTTLGEIHFALWSVFDPNALVALNAASGGTVKNGVVDVASPDYTATIKQLGYAIDAVKNDGASNYSSFISQFTIYSPDPSQQTCLGAPLTCSVTTSQKNPPQEFLVKTPEAPFFAVLGVDLSGLGAVIFLLRRRRTSRS